MDTANSWRKGSATRGGPQSTSSTCRVVPTTDDKDRDVGMNMNFGVGHGHGHDFNGHGLGHRDRDMDVGVWRRKGSAERMAPVAQRALPPPAGHRLHCPSVLSQRKVPFHADSGDFPGVRAATPLDSDASIWDSSPN